MPTIVITGASQGIGQAIAEAFSKEPEVRLALVARSKEKLDAVAAQCRTQGAEAAVFPCDVTDDAAVQEVAQAILAQWGAPDVLVNNAGLFQPGTVVETPASVFRQQVAVNLTSAFVVTQAFLEPMIAQGQGHIFYMASVASIRAYEGGRRIVRPNTGSSASPALCAKRPRPKACA